MKLNKSLGYRAKMSKGAMRVVDAALATRSSRTERAKEWRKKHVRK